MCKEQGDGLGVAQGAANDFPSVARVCYLAGGLAALNNPGNKLQFCAGVPGPVLGEFEIATYGSLFAHISQIGPLVVGCQFYQDADELEGLRPAPFRVYECGQGWSLNEAWQRWRQLAATAMRINILPVADCAARVAFELEAVEQRILELCVAYSKQLRALMVKREIEQYKRFDDLNSGPVINGVHALFYELAVLRDYLAEFIACYVFGIVGKKGEPVRKMAVLRKRLLARPVEDELLVELIAATNNKDSSLGWLAVLSAYRDVFTHVAPMQQIGTRGFVVQEQLTIAGGGTLPVLYHPLPKFAQVRSHAFPFERFEEWAKASLSHHPDRSEQPDALEYLHKAVNQMANLAKRVIVRSPIRPQPIQFGPKDAIGPITVTYGV